VEEIGIDAEKFLTHAGAILASAPIQHAQFGPGWDRAGSVCSRLDGCPSLMRLQSVSLTFGCYHVSDSDFLVLAAAPRLLERLDSLFVVECPVTEVGLRPLVTSPHLHRLRSLSLSECECRGAPGVRPLSESSRLNHLTYLCLGKNGLGDAGVGTLVFSPNCRPLQSLDLSRCGVGDEGVSALAWSPHLSRLRDLYLWDNDIGADGAEALASATTFEGLCTLWLGGNNIGERGRKALRERFGESVCRFE
jgi:hypothetical protein